MAVGKWIGGFLGWMAGGPLGALAGYLLGSLFDSAFGSVNILGNSGTYDYGSTRDSGFRAYEEIYREAYQRQQAQGNRNSFLFSLLVLSSYIIKADGKAMHSEMEMAPKLEKNHVLPSSSQDEALCPLKHLKRSPTFHSEVRNGICAAAACRPPLFYS